MGRQWEADAAVPETEVRAVGTEGNGQLQGVFWRSRGQDTERLGDQLEVMATRFQSLD